MADDTPITPVASPQASTSPLAKAKKTGESVAKTRSVALSYAKDLCVASKIKVFAIVPCAEVFYRWLTESFTMNLAEKDFRTALKALAKEGVETEEE